MSQRRTFLPVRINNKTYESTRMHLCKIIEEFQQDTEHYPRQMPWDMSCYIIRRLGEIQDSIALESSNSI